MSHILENRFLEAIRQQLQGLSDKVTGDFSKENFDSEMAALQGDPVYEKFSFNRAEYVLIRFMGRISISIGRRLGEIYDKVPRFVAAARFNLTPEQVAPKIDGLELDISLNLELLSPQDQAHVKETYKRFVGRNLNEGGLGIEIRYNFNPNDSSRLRKDVEMGEKLSQIGLTPIYLVFSTISPRNDAISRLRNNGWTFLIGDDAIQFITVLLGLEIHTILDKPEIKAEIKAIVDTIMDNLVESYSFKQVSQKKTVR